MSKNRSLVILKMPDSILVFIFMVSVTIKEPKSRAQETL